MKKKTQSYSVPIIQKELFWFEKAPTAHFLLDFDLFIGNRETSVPEILS